MSQLTPIKRQQATPCKGGIFTTKNLQERNIQTRPKKTAKHNITIA